MEVVLGAANRDLPRLIQGSEEPILRGQGDIDYLCSGCSSVLAVSLLEGSVWDLGLKCFRCGTLSESPELPEGRPLPSSTAFCPPGEYLIGGTVSLPARACLVGATATAKATAVGAPLPFEQHATPAMTLNEMADRFESLRMQLRELLGGVLERVMKSHHKAKTSKTPPARQHRLGFAMDQLDASIKNLRDGRAHVSTAVAELQVAMELFRRWENDPGWPRILSSLTNPTDYAHTLLLLVTANHLRDAGNAIGLQPETTARTADLWVITGASEHCNIEVKSPQILVDPPAVITPQEASKVIGDTTSKAGLGRSGQLKSDHPGLLLIGGFGLNSEDLAPLRTAAEEFLATSGPRYPHFMGFVLTSLQVLATNIVNVEQGVALGGPGTSFEGVAQVELVRNPSYSGAVRLDSSPGPGTRIVDGPIVELPSS